MTGSLIIAFLALFPSIGDVALKAQGLVRVTLAIVDGALRMRLTGRVHKAVPAESVSVVRSEQETHEQPRFPISTENRTYPIHLHGNKRNKYRNYLLYVDTHMLLQCALVSH